MSHIGGHSMLYNVFVRFYFYLYDLNMINVSI